MKCCLCGDPEAPHVEHRYSGWDEKKLKPWAFCEKCFQHIKSEEENQDPWITGRYAMFLEYLAGRYDRRIVRNVSRKSGRKKRVDTYTHVQIHSSHAKELHTFNRDGSFNTDETPGDPGEPGRIDNYGGALQGVLGESREESREEENLTRMEAGPDAAATATGP